MKYFLIICIKGITSVLHLTPMSDNRIFEQGPLSLTLYMNETSLDNSTFS